MPPDVYTEAECLNRDGNETAKDFDAGGLA